MKYLEQYKILHSTKRYGTSSERLAKHILPLISRKQPKSILDYGCGRSQLLDWLPAEEKVRYDPAIPEFDTYPSKKFDVVICTDVLEHVPEEEVDEVLKNLSSLGKDHIITISLDTAYHKLPNGDNCHCTVKDKEWWMDKEELSHMREVKHNSFPVKFLFLTSLD